MLISLKDEDWDVSMNSGFYDEDYFQYGLESGKSGYSRYRWMPEETCSMAMAMIDYLGIKPEHKILDFGCAFGYLVKAFRILKRRAWGVDISEYAIGNAEWGIARYLSFSCNELMYFWGIGKFDFCIAKDVFEHIPLGNLSCFLGELKADKLFAIIPLGDEAGYWAPLNNLDESHVVCETDKWWKDFFKEHRWELLDFNFKLPGIKDSWQRWPKAHGFFLLRRGK